MPELPMEGVKHGQGVMPWTPKSGYTNCWHVTNVNPETPGHPFISYFLHVEGVKGSSK